MSDSWKWHMANIVGFGDCLFEAKMGYDHSEFPFRRLTRIFVHPQTGAIGLAKYFPSEAGMHFEEGVMQKTHILFMFDPTDEMGRKCSELWSGNRKGNGIVPASGADLRKLGPMP